MRVKTLFIFITLGLSALIAIAGCEGKTGAMGPAGPAGLIISSISATPGMVLPNRTASAVVNAHDYGNNALTYTWTASEGWKVTGYGMTATITAPGAYNSTGTISVTVSDGLASVTGTTLLSTVPQLVINKVNLSSGAQPFGIAIDGTGNAWVANQTNNSVTEISSAGTTITTITVGGSPVCIAIDKAGNVWVTNNVGNSISELTYPDYTTINSYPGIPSPYGIAIDKSGNVWVANNAGNSVSELTEPAYASIISYPGFFNPLSIAIDASGNVWVANNGNGTISEILAASGYTFTRTMQTNGNPLWLAIDPSGNVWSANGGNVISELIAATNYNQLNTHLIRNTSGSPINFTGIVIDAAGNIWLTNMFAISELTEPTYSVMTTYSLGSLSIPWGIALDAYGDVWTTNQGPASSVTEIIGVAAGPQFWPYTGPVFPGGM